LHDSIAQGLNFLNLQVQMLEDSQKRGQMTEVEDIIPLLRAGVQESYEDVRELLLNFRTRLQESDFEAEVQNVLKRFERQTAIQANLEVSGQGAPLGPEQQLQVLFILQEALSNIRKHAQADQVLVSILNERDFTLRVEDNGRGFSAAELAEKGDSHVGLRIMQERAAQMSANLDIQSASGEGTRVILNLMRHERRVA
jgi:two-component system nitrate/nitrite sensor histidine kinase NarX